MTDIQKFPDLSYLSDPHRLAVITRIGLPDNLATPTFDRLTQIAAKCLGAPASTMTVIDADRVLYQSCIGIPKQRAAEVPSRAEQSFCQYVVADNASLAITDARIHPLVKDSYATKELGVVSYLGVPLVIDGHAVGTLCVVDDKPRKWTAEDTAVLDDIAKSIISEIRLWVGEDEITRQNALIQAERKQLRHSETMFRLATESARLGIFEWSAAEDRAVWKNDRMYEIFNRAREQGPTSADDFINHVSHPDDREAFKTALSAAVTHGRFDYTGRFFCGQGTTRWVEFTGQMVKDANGNYSDMAAVAADITEPKQAAEDLRKSEERYRTLFNTMDEGFCVIEMIYDEHENPVDYRYLETNPAFEGLTGMIDAVGKKVREFAPNLEFHWFEAFSSVARTGVSIRLENTAKEVGDRWYDVYAFRVGEAGENKVALLFNDITERRRQEIQLVEAKLLLESMLAAGNIGTWTWDLPTDQIIVDENIANMFGMPPEQSRTGPLQYILDLIHPDDHASIQEKIGRAIASSDSYDAEYRLVRPNGETRWMVARGRVRRDEAGKAIQFPGVVIDITDQKRLQEQLTDADRRKDEFLAMLAHELRNPLGAISSGVQLVQMAKKPEVLAELRDMIQHQVKHLTHLIDDLLDVSRITQNKVELRKQTVDLVEVTSKAAELAQQQIEEKRHKLTVTTPTHQVAFVADPTRVEQMLANLLTNAAKYSEPGRSILLSANVEEKKVVFRVRDQGFGITAEMLPRIFGLFTQIDATIDRSRGGLGIGLTVVKSLAEMHGGSVTATSEGKDKGSEFILRLPIGEPAAMEAKPVPVHRPASAPLSNTDHRILIIDDNRDTARMTSQLLEHRGYRMMVAYDGFEGIEAAKAFSPHFILLDIGLPGLNGYEVATALRNDESCRQTVIIGVSGYGETAARERSAKAGFNHHLTKPLDFDQLYGILRMCQASSG